MQQTFVIVGAGQAAAQAVDSLRRDGFDGRLVVVGDEPHLPYQRPPLSKKFLAGEMPSERLFVKPATFYETSRAELKLGVRAEGLDLHRRELRLSDGDVIGYDKALLATGTAPRKVTVPGNELGGVHYLRSIADVDRIRAELATAKRVVVVGAGYIGLEVAATCRKLGLEVDVLEMADRPMNRVVAPEVSAFFAAEHAREGVRIHVETLVSGFEARLDDASRVGCVHTLDGRQFPADVVIVGIGVVPVTGLAAAAGLAVENGIAVDEHCRTSDEHVYAAGDCTNHPSLRYHRRVRLESVDNAFEQAKSASANMLGRGIVHDKVPWFWSDQYDLKLLIVGLNFDYDRAVVRGDPATRAFSCCYLRGQELLAIDCVNNPKDYMAAKKLIAERAHFDLAKLADAAVALKDAVAP
jgi:3-phenylpropionate/trans-cinnamate dioxygenase ferredoxin reductase subunit